MKKKKVFIDYIHENICAVDCRWDKEYVYWCDTDDINYYYDDDDDGENNGNDEDLT